MTHVWRVPVVTSRQTPSGRSLPFPVCGMWDCIDEDDWEVITWDHPDYAAVKREYNIVHYHQPTSEWRIKLVEERARLIGSDEPLWWGKPQNLIV